MGLGKILLLSDGSAIFPVLDRVFTDAGYQVTTTCNGKDAVEAIRTGDFPLMFTRITRNLREVYTVVRSIRKQQANTIAIFLRGEPAVHTPIGARRVKGQEAAFLPWGWAGLRRLVAHCLSA